MENKGELCMPKLKGWLFPHREILYYYTRPDHTFKTTETYFENYSYGYINLIKVL